MIHQIKTLISAAKKHHTEVRYSLKKNPVIKHDTVMRIPSRYIFLTPEIKKGIRVALR